MRFDGQVAIITGAATGLGRAYAIALAQRGAHVALIDSGYSQEQDIKTGRTELESTIDAVSKIGAEASAFAIDVCDEVAIADMVNKVIKRWGRVDVLIHNASIHQPCAFERLTKAQWQRQLDVDVNACFNLTKLIWPIMKQQSYGRIIVSSAASGLYGNIYETCFSTSKMALVGFVNSLSMEGVDYNICVNAIIPHALTKMNENHLAPEVKALFSMSSVKAVMLFLSSKLAPTGQHLLVGAGSVSRGGFTEFVHVSIEEEDCKPEKVHDRWHEIMHAAPCCQHASAEAQVTAWARRRAQSRGIDIE
ncbi:SDR family NAD(P)-dependent oxidoreductase [Shewanella sp. Isolate11]|uniref:SDR family NAD(P)-dependent oxidoreductase n=1 Tax=Shewanella sp. Isolate11 TaxID=2908530 RepID=UPI001EFC5CCE|nr:SDR family NAD(P)-dependent oxidoreductase [Shewanella sp. Isolate11]MCG9696192.1 SDR family NAD(P)-dependent oxidoreductase [Shewanella sp. Isolate11]